MNQFTRAHLFIFDRTTQEWLSIVPTACWSDSSLHKARAESLASCFPASSTARGVPANSIATRDNMFLPGNSATLEDPCVVIRHQMEHSGLGVLDQFKAIRGFRHHNSPGTSAGRGRLFIRARQLDPVSAVSTRSSWFCCCSTLTSSSSLMH